jgi:hypothetical protein
VHEAQIQHTSSLTAQAVRHARACLVALTLAIANIGALSQVQSPVLQPGCIIYGDSGDAIQGGFIIGVDPHSGQEWVISSGNHLRSPAYLSSSDDGQLLVSDAGLLLRIEVLTGKQTVIAELGSAWGIALDRDGDILAATWQGIVRVDHIKGEMKLISTGGYLRVPLAVAVAYNGDLVVLDAGWPNRVIGINPHNGKQVLLHEGGDLHGSQAIAISGDDIYVTCVATPDGNFGIGRVVHIDLRTGTQTVVSEGGHLVRPVGIAIDDDGQLVICDPYTINPESADLFDGGVISVDPASGVQTIIARGHDSTINPCGVAIIKEPKPSNKK